MLFTIGNYEGFCGVRNSSAGARIGATNVGCLARGVWAIALFSALLLTAVQAAQAQSESVLYSFCPQAGCTDGALPDAGLVMDTKGNLYGTTQNGGNDACSNGCGTAFELTASLTERVLHSFGSNATDGLQPLQGLVLGKKGVLYGSTPGGGAVAGSPGTVYKVTTSGAETVLYDFCSLKGCIDGFYPDSPLIMDKSGNLYGTVADGGENGGGTVFEFTAAGSLITLYNFCSQPRCADGQSPKAGLVMDKKGNLYGTTYAGGENDYGTVFVLFADETEKVLHSFTNDGTDGYYPVAGLVINKNNLYGTTPSGGTVDGGVIFQVNMTTGTENVLHSFTDTPDGFAPYAPLVLDSKTGDFFGTTSGGGTNHYGTVFEFIPSATVSVLHSFNNDGVDGVYPYAPVVMDKTGNLYGTTQLGGTNNKGTVFKVTP